jgi:asparagine synthetase B (glutamine-hydrolysing)
LLNIFLKFKKTELDNLINYIEGRFIIISSNETDSIKIYQDKFGKYDLFYFKKKSSFLISNNFQILVNEDDKKINVHATTLMLTSYATRPAKKDTIFDNIKRLGISEKIQIKKANIKIITDIFLPNYSETYSEDKITSYFEIFKNYLKNNDTEKNKIIFMSSGFDSSFLTALLTKLFNRKNIFGVTCMHKFNSRSGIYNRFEVERVKKLSKHYGIKTFFIDVNFKDNFEKMSEEISEVSSKRMLFSQIASYMHHVLSIKAKKLNLGKSLYSGEISDGMHNMGFSQLVSSTSNPSHGFREYEDKKTNYLYSPTFQNLILKNEYLNDQIFNDFYKKNKYEPKKKKFNNYSELVIEIFNNLFLTQKRLLLDKSLPTLMNSDSGENYKNYFFKKYFKEVKIKNSKQFYSSVQYLYNSFHWQGSTVSTLNHYPAANGLKMYLPFWNTEVQKFTEKMPENWGRGLELRPTKFPLKEAFKKFLSYPTYLEEGPHSYMYDINQYVSPHTELIINPKTKNYILKIFKKYHPLEFLDKKNFKHNLISQQIKRYSKGDEKFIINNCNTIWNLYSFSKMMYDLKI